MALEEPRADARSGGRFGRFGPIRICLILSQILTAIAFIITLAGLSALQHKANTLPLSALNRADPAIATPLVNTYSEVFQSSNQVPYPFNGSWQFGFQWYILWLEVALFTWIGVMAIFPRTILRLKHVAMCLLAYAFVLTTLQINSLLYFKRTPIAGQTFGQKNIKVTLAGTMMGAICNGLTIIFLGLIGTGHDFTGRYDRNWSQGGMLKRRNRKQVSDSDIETGDGVATVTAANTAANTGHTGTLADAPRAPATNTAPMTHTPNGAPTEVLRTDRV